MELLCLWIMFAESTPAVALSVQFVEEQSLIKLKTKCALSCTVACAARRLERRAIL
jgi:hypothetical protein